VTQWFADFTGERERERERERGLILVLPLLSKRPDGAFSCEIKKKKKMEQFFLKKKQIY
jgi:hypothetical protein